MHHTSIVAAELTVRAISSRALRLPPWTVCLTVR